MRPFPRLALSLLCLAALAAPLAAPVAAQEQMIGFEKIQQLSLIHI